MTTYFISRHPGALEWMKRRGPAFDRHVEHLDLDQIKAGDVLIGSLPVNLAAEVCARNAQYFNLSLQLPAHARGRELSVDELDSYEAKIEAFDIRKVISKKCHQR
ncbi:MAG: CRISPR-associated protein Csx16 [Parahaliea sp.]